MSTVGVFAGRGDVIVAIALALLVGGWCGWQLRGVAYYFKNKRKN